LSIKNSVSEPLFTKDSTCWLSMVLLFMLYV
jgi:hypothetical protein